MKKIILVTEIISPYRIPVFNEIARGLKDRFRVFFLGETEKRRKWKIYKQNIKFYYEVLPSILFQRKDASPYFFNPTIICKLMKYSPEIIITGGYQHPSYFLAMLYAKFFRKRIILWCESNKHDQRCVYFWKEYYKRWFVRNCSGCIVPGKASFEYIVSLGADSKNIWIAPNAVDSDYFSRERGRYIENKKAFKKDKCFPEKLILYVGRLIDQKGILDLLNAFHIISNKQADLGLLCVGEGAELEKYRRFCKIKNIKNVFFTGFIHQEELPFYYALADIFILPSHSEVWGLVLNEAMASKLPVIASDAAGAARDLIIDGENGYIYQKGNIKELVEAIEKVLNSDRIAMGAKSYEIIHNFSPQKCAQGFIRMIEEIPQGKA